MKRAVRSALSVLSVLGFSSLAATAVAQSAATAPRPSDQPAALQTKYDFDDDRVDGNLQRADGETLLSSTKANQQSLIELRKDFVPETLKSADEI